MSNATGMFGDRGEGWQFMGAIHSNKLDCIIITRSSAIAVIADRTACSILTLFIAIATSRPLNKKNPFAVSPRIQQLLRICVRNPHTALSVSACRDGAGALRGLPAPVTAVTMPYCNCWQTSRAVSTTTTMHTCCLNPWSTLMAFLTFLWLNDTSYSKVSEGTNRNMPARNTLEQLLALYTNPESQNAQRYRQTDGQQAAANSRSYCIAVQEETP